MVTIAYLTQDEFKDFGFDEVEDFEKLLQRAEIAINLFLNNFYSFVDFEKEIGHRKQAVKLATAFQVAYLDASGITTADDKQSVSTVVLGRTHITYKNSSNQSLESARYNLSLDALNTLKSAGFGFRGVGYDRH
uniref:Head Tail Connector Protein n=1 Tax=Siphoviridae sp. ctfM019 TaxID=2827908 RepID=A0A8S5SS06_9CAUD|nr:MAG TPA: Putative Head Tail Connector Protein [Siphoviridae sp. ctfM019]DAX30407.1 MAG TPA: Putative Head Tail Connector Protein [Caudoviricetes sp.]DAX74051.1 MAG TPA: Putative Head Tail Connector Protein [Caudoviricetes sp.]